MKYLKSPFFFFLIPAVALFVTASYMNAKPAAGGAIVEFTDANFQSKALSSNKLTIVDFWAEWCGPCRAMGPVIEDLSDEYAGKVNIGKLNVDHNPTITTRYDISSIPTILFIKNGKVVDKLVGVFPKSKLERKIKQHM